MFTITNTHQLRYKKNDSFSRNIFYQNKQTWSFDFGSVWTGIGCHGRFSGQPFVSIKLSIDIVLFDEGYRPTNVE